MRSCGKASSLRTGDSDQTLLSPVDSPIYGLLQSSLIMGVHSGCPVCSIVAALLVAVETDVGETISAANVALCVVSGLLELMRSFLRLDIGSTLVVTEAAAWHHKVSAGIGVPCVSRL